MSFFIAKEKAEKLRENLKTHKLGEQLKKHKKGKSQYEEIRIM